MAWMLYVYESAANLDVWGVTVALAKSAGGAVGGYFLKRVWRGIMGGSVTNKCIIKGCMRHPAENKRGLCLVCYGKAKEKVEAGEVTWDKLAEMGLCSAGSADPFDDAYSRAMDDQLGIYKD